MAKRRTTRGKGRKTASRSRNATREVAAQHELPGGFWRQVFAVLMLAVAIMLVMTWFGSGGSALNNIHSGATWLIGFAAYLIPILLVYLAVMIFRSDDNTLPIVMWIAAVLMVVWVAGIMGIPTIGQTEPTGGVVGEGLNSVAIQFLAPGVAVFIYLVLIFITAIFILQTNPATVFRAIFSMFKTTKKDEDAKNAKLARKAAASEGDEMGELKVKVGGIVADNKKKPALKVKTPEKKPVAAPSPTPERALVSVSDPNWKMPPMDLLEKKESPPDYGNTQQNAYIIQSTFAEFGIEVEMDGANVGPKVTQYTMKPPAGMSLSKILGHDKELALNLAVESVRIEAPIPGTRLVGVEIPNIKAGEVRLRSILESPEWKKTDKPLTFAVGKDISGKVVMADLAKMPHLLIGGTTGSGKSVMTNALIVSLLYRNSPSDLKLILIDPKQVEMSQYDDIPHLLSPIITESDKAVSAVKWAMNEMERRYTLMKEEHVKNIVDYNRKMEKQGGKVTVKDKDGNEQKHDGGKMPYIVVIVDEMSDIMMQAGKELEPPIVRIAQKGRAAGIHLVLATQNPVVKVVTGLIKANVPARLAFAVQNFTESNVMLGMAGAEKLLGQGDMLMLTQEMVGKPRRVQGSWISSEEQEAVADFLREQRPPEYNDDVVSQTVALGGGGVDGAAIGGLGRKFNPQDPYVRKAVEISISNGQFSTSALQTQLSKGHGFVSGLAMWLFDIGVIGPKNGNKPRDVLITSMEEFDERAAGQGE